ncbi:MAG: hypothetical protein U0892_11590 [Pirellulales bacterium]
MLAESRSPHAHRWSQPATWFWIAAIILLPWHIGIIASDPWLKLPPKPTGDGPDYENIAFHLWHGKGFSTDWLNDEWREPYAVVERDVSELIDPASRPSESQRHAYYVQFSRTDGLAPTTARPPLYPLVIASIYTIVGRSPNGFAAVRIFSAICLALAGAIAAWTTVRTIRSLTSSNLAIVISGSTAIGLSLLDRTARSYCTDFLTEPLAMLLTQLLIYLWLSGFRSENESSATFDKNGSAQRRRTIGIGLIAGALVLTRSITLFWLPGLSLLMWISGDGAVPRRSENDQPNLRTQRFMQLGMMLVSCMLVLGPWWARNCAVLDRLMPLGTQGPITLLGGYCDEATTAGGEWQGEPELRLRAECRHSFWHRARLERTRSLRKHRRDEFIATSVNTWNFPLFLMRVVTEWNPYTGKSLIWKILMVIGAVVIITSSLERRAGRLLVGLLLINTLTVMVLYSVGGRFLVPTYGIMYSLAAIGAATPVMFASCMRRRHTEQSAA